jgi:hypothetical protein
LEQVEAKREGEVANLRAWSVMCASDEEQEEGVSAFVGLGGA